MAFALEPDDYLARYVGWTSDERQFFLTRPFVPAARGSSGHEFLALYLFDKYGTFVEARIEDLGTREGLDEAAIGAKRAEFLASLGEVVRRRVILGPFEVERFGVVFGFVLRRPERRGGDWQVTAEPGNYMAFSPPWGSGLYDT